MKRRKELVAFGLLQEAEEAEFPRGIKPKFLLTQESCANIIVTCSVITFVGEIIWLFVYFQVLNCH